MQASIVFADNLARLNGIYRLSGAEAAAALGVSRQTVSEWQTGKRPQPSLDALYRSAEVFEIDADILLRRPFIEWASAYLGDAERFERVSRRVASRTRASAVPSLGHARSEAREEGVQRSLNQ
jgi:transcriptional regulator with XRE-family HTH domain